MTYLQFTETPRVGNTLIAMINWGGEVEVKVGNVGVGLSACCYCWNSTVDPGSVRCMAHYMACLSDRRD